jgi:CubicO group peptidase (beta-lactamase class C family)
MSSDELMVGAPPPEQARVSLANWQEPPFNRWSFQHLREVIPSQRISRGEGAARSLYWELDPGSVEDLPVTRVNGEDSTVARVLADTWTDAVLIMHQGAVVLERYYTGMLVDSPHLLMSVSKSLVGCVTGILADQEVVDPQQQVSKYVPEIAGSGYDGARVRDLLDMRSGVAFSEAYHDPDAEVRVIERHMGWRPREDGQQDLGLYGYLATLGTDTDHGKTFVYRSADTDMLGWVCERAAGARMADLISVLLWRPMGAEYDAEVSCDAYGSAVHDGGISTTARDLARFGQLLLDDGMVEGRQVVPPWWLQEARTPDADVRDAFAASESEPFLPGGWYRNQFWHLPARNGNVQLCLGIHGQMVLVDHNTSTVAVKFSTWPDPQNPGYLSDTISAFTTAGRHLAGLPATTTPAAERPTAPAGEVAGEHLQF